MSNQPENEIQPSSTLEEVRQSLLAELDASKQTITDLSDEELEAIAGGGTFGDAISGIRAVFNLTGNVGTALLKGPSYGMNLGNQGIQGPQAMYEHGVNHLWGGPPQGPKK
jgi:hypothetical protein